MQACQKRLRDLDAVASETGRVKDAHVRKLLAFTNSLRVCSSIYALAPLDVIHYLFSLDGSASTRVHKDGCPQKGKPNNKLIVCGCPKRAKAESLKTARKMLSRGLADAGLLNDWSEQTKTGNPAKSRLVRDYEAAINREQLRADVLTRRAPLFDYSVFNKLMLAIRAFTAQAIKDRDHLAAHASLVDAFLYSFMYFTGDRLQDALERDWGRIQRVSDVPHLSGPDTSTSSTSASIHWHIRRGLSKTRQSMDGPRSHLLKDDGSIWNPISIAGWLGKFEARLGITPGIGHLFKKMKRTPGSAALQSRRVTIAQAADTFKRWTAVAGLPAALTTHSFHPSHAIWRLDNGETEEDILRNMLWSTEQLWRYLDQPILTASTLPRPNATATFRTAAAKACRH